MLLNREETAKQLHLESKNYFILIKSLILLKSDFYVNICSQMFHFRGDFSISAGEPGVRFHKKCLMGLWFKKQ